MLQHLLTIISDELAALFELKKTERLWHIPVLASICVGVPVFMGWYFNHLSYGVIACTGGLVILYMPATGLRLRMITMLACSFGFLMAYTVGILFSFHPLVFAFVLAIFAFAVHFATGILSLRPPGNFFFVMLAVIAGCQPFDLQTIPLKIGLVALSTMFACVLAFFYSWWAIHRYPPKRVQARAPKQGFDHVFESVLFGVFIGLSFFLAWLLGLKNPYWVPISCLAVLQGINRKHVLQRSFQRVLGTGIGMLVGWLILYLDPSELGMVISLLSLQFVVEMLIVRHYALAVVFITPMTLLLAEAASPSGMPVNDLIATRFIDIVIGSTIGAIGGWFLYHQQLRYHAKRQLRISAIRKRK